MESKTTPDFRSIFESLPENYLILLPDTPHFTIVAVSDAYAKATKTVREQILGKGLFEVFPDNPNDPKATGVANLTASLNRVLVNRTIDFMAIQKYDIPRPERGPGVFEERYWSPDNSPICGEDGSVTYIIHHVTDVTEQEMLLRMYGGSQTDGKEAGAGHITQVKRMEKIMIEREVKMSELKKEIEALKGKQ